MKRLILYSGIVFHTISLGAMGAACFASGAAFRALYQEPRQTTQIENLEGKRETNYLIDGSNSMDGPSLSEIEDESQRNVNEPR